ncbi:molybdate ABC transporter substrate-binding protein [Actinobacillus equuli]|uniref:molybdate ABC transporter substrate-binding protein n=1 Tax=Actinobacillus equuli TaxID=718 RepID=UPI002441A7BE|nr:molybdate ABC transporter substrate-binding protein [Actinobacillus equuli]WGE59424.1 molybdate ABC transporter substrate-binding protein [Actinobacillus equuli subsp. haemolyticus]WGE61936.1 molybdate ABC transporter substrate-binding protein [Actinobacillus equuli subsp. haemolyticus]
MKALTKLFLIGSILFSSSLALATDITVFAASSMTNVLQEINQDFAKQYPDDKVVFSFASSSVLAKQIEQDAPADVFISADLKWMDYLKEKQPAKTQNIRYLVKNNLVLIAPKDSPLTTSDIQAVDFDKILANSYLSVGDPAHVPAGKYAKKALEYYDLWQQVEPRIARAKNVRDALSFVERGESPLGIVYSTDAKVSDKVKVIAVFPTESYGEIIYPAATVNDKVQAKTFLDFLTTPEAKAKFKAAGFYPVN